MPRYEDAERTIQEELRKDFHHMMMQLDELRDEIESYDDETRELIKNILKAPAPRLIRG